MKKAYYESHIKPLRNTVNFLTTTKQLNDFQIKWCKKQILETTRAYKDDRLIMKGKQEIYRLLNGGDLIKAVIYITALKNTLAKKA